MFHKLLVNQALLGPMGASQSLGVILDGAARHTAEGHEFVKKSMAAGFKEAVRARDEPFGDFGASTYKGKPPG
jgi:enoyl-CoA hydratase